VVAKVGLDGHDRGARVLARMLREEGFEVVYVGIRHTPDQVADITVAEDADVVALSILSGAHVALCAAVRSALDARGLAHVPIAVGGLIPRSDGDALTSAGTARAFHPGDSGIDAGPVTSAMDALVDQSRAGQPETAEIGAIRAGS
jgi:methylmalonyl-CoA mutase C-terminal domain/subunit